MDLELAGNFTRGMTVVDQRELTAITAGNADVAMSADSAGVLDLLYETLSALQ